MRYFTIAIFTIFMLNGCANKKPTYKSIYEKIEKKAQKAWKELH